MELCFRQARVPQINREFAFRFSRSALNGEFGLTPIFGVCLGHQALGEVSGGHVGKAQRVMHGKASLISHDSKGLFAGMPNPFSAIRYHSLVIKQGTLPPEFEVTATSLDDNEIMGIKHRSLPIEGVQFHPESILTEGGLQIVRNFVEQTQTSC